LGGGRRVERGLEIAFVGGIGEEKWYEGRNLRDDTEKWWGF
jgi:hypothetical protein